MADFLTHENRSRLMSRIKSTANGTTELRVIRMLRQAGLSGWRRREKLPGKPDFVWRDKKVAVFVDGCFWHNCPTHGHVPHSRRNYWLPKLARNQKRDRQITKHLRKLGWRVIRVWEHELARTDVARIACRISRALSKF